MPNFEHVSGDKDWKKWIRALNRATAGLGLASYQIQLLTGEAIANRLRQFLLDGVEPELSPMSNALKGGKEKPLAALAKHVVVIPPKEGPPRKTSKGNTTQFHPVEIGFEEGWEVIAFILENGATFKPSARAKKAILDKAFKAGFKLEEGMGTGGLWIIPPRRFSHVLTDKSAMWDFKRIAMDVFKGKIKDVQKINVKPEREDLESNGQPSFVNFDDLAEVLSTNPWEDGGESELWEEDD